MKYSLIFLSMILSGCATSKIVEFNLDNPRKNVIMRTFPYSGYARRASESEINEAMTNYCHSGFEVVSKKEKTEITDDFLWLVASKFIDIEFSCKDSNEKKVSSTNK